MSVETDSGSKIRVDRIEITKSSEPGDYEYEVVGIVGSGGEDQRIVARELGDLIIINGSIEASFGSEGDVGEIVGVFKDHSMSTNLMMAGKDGDMVNIWVGRELASGRHG